MGHTVPPDPSVSHAACPCGRDTARIEQNERLRQAVDVLLGAQRSQQNRHQILWALRRALGADRPGVVGQPIHNWLYQRHLAGWSCTRCSTFVSNEHHALELPWPPDPCRGVQDG